MKHDRRDIAETQAWIEALVACADREAAERLLLRAASNLSVARNVSLWRRAREGARGGAWRLIRSSGAAEHLASEGLVNASLDAELGPCLSSSCTVLLAGRRQVALALGGLSGAEASPGKAPDDEGLDALEAVLAVFCSIDRAHDGDGHDPEPRGTPEAPRGDHLGRPLPRPRDGEPPGAVP